MFVQQDDSSGGSANNDGDDIWYGRRVSFLMQYIYMSMYVSERDRDCVHTHARAHENDIYC